MERTGGIFTEQVIRPTGLIDPPGRNRAVETQVDDLIAECHLIAKRGYRALVTTLTKKMAEDLTEYMHEQGIRVRYMHSMWRPWSGSRSSAICVWARSTC
jgi:excinuclease ABC subunit B